MRLMPRPSRARQRPARTAGFVPILLMFVGVAWLVPARGLPPPGQAVLSAQDDKDRVVDHQAYQGLKWRSVGPHRGGRVTAIAGVRTRPNVFYMGATGGGVWKTEDYGISWRPVSDGQIDTGSIGAIEVSDSTPNIVYVGTGSAAIRSNVIIGRGMYKSLDAGSTWQFIGLREAGQIGSVAVHPTNPDVVWVAALGSPFGRNDERGIFKTTDGGKNWRKTLFVNAETGGRVVAVNWSNPDELYAGMYRGFRKGWDIVSGGPASEGGLYKSVDGGETWAKLANGLPQALIGKIDLAIAMSSPRVVYAMIEAPGPEGGLYKSSDAGATWTLVNNEPRLRTRPFYFHYVDVNPRDADEVWVNELRLHRSNDGGKTFTQVATPHGDNHGIWFNPDNPQIAIQCNDGGANVTQDGGRSWSSILNQPTAEIYMLSVDERFPYRIYGPQQDNSTVIVPSVPDAGWDYDHQAQSWAQGPGCETGQIHPRPDGAVVWGVCKGEIGRLDVSTGQEQHYWVYPQHRYGHDPDEITYRFQRQSVIAISPHDPGTVYHASHVVHRTTDEGLTWEPISPDLTAREPDKQIVPGNPITRDVTGEEVYSAIYAMVESRIERGVLWTGANDGPVHVSRDGGKTWANVTPADVPPGGRVQNIEDSPHRKGSAYVAVYRFLREHDLRPYIYVTHDYGKTWTRLTDGTNGVPADHPTRVVREDPRVEGLLYAGTEFGVFVSFDHGRRWQSLQQNLPATPVTDIRVHRDDLVVSTMGRSFWVMDNVTLLQQVASGMRGAGASGRGGITGDWLYTPRAAYRMRYASRAARPDGPEYPPPAAHIDYALAGTPPDEITLEIVGPKGTPVHSFSSDAEAAPRDSSQGMRGPSRSGAGGVRVARDVGHNRFTWDLRYPVGPGGGSGPHVVPGRYEAKLSIERAGRAVTYTVPLEVRIDPRVAAAGVTQADLEAQLDLLLKIRDRIAEARRLQDRLARAMDAAGVRPPPAPGPGQSPGTATYASPLQLLWARLVTAPGPYPQPMLIDQFANVARMLGRADQRPGKDAWDRYHDLAKELAALEGEATKASGH